MRQRIEQLIAQKKNVNINFAAPSGTRLVSIAGTISEVGDDYLILNDIYGNWNIVPFSNIAFIDVRK